MRACQTLTGDVKMLKGANINSMILYLNEVWQSVEKSGKPVQKSANVEAPSRSRSRPQ